MTVLSSGQLKVYDRIMDWFENSDNKRFVLAGYAGAGKTTMARFIADSIDPDRVIFCAYTGKAANVLKEKGCATAGTLHGYLYQLKDHNKEIIKKLEGQILQAMRDKDEPLIKELSKTLAAKRTEFKKPIFSLSPRIEFLNAPLIIVDEYSMLPDRMIEDIEKYAKKVLYIGDPFQLPPVHGECSLIPTAFIDEIHRQALDSPIIWHSKEVREGRAITYCDMPEFKYISRTKASIDMFTAADQIIVGKNKTRQEWNKRFRCMKGFDHSPLPVKGDKMICLKNNHEIGLFNGMIGECKDAIKESEDKYVLDFDDIFGLNVWAGDVLNEGEKYDGYDPYFRQFDRFDFAYAITCHKSQGSEFDKVTVYNQPIGKEMRERQRWLYTAITRGKKQVILVDPR